MCKLISQHLDVRDIYIYGVFFSFDNDSCSVPVIAVLYITSWYIKARYNGIWLCVCMHNYVCTFSMYVLIGYYVYVCTCINVCLLRLFCKWMRLSWLKFLECWYDRVCFVYVHRSMSFLYYLVVLHRSRHFLSLKLRYFHNTMCPWVGNECCC